MEESNFIEHNKLNQLDKELGNLVKFEAKLFDIFLIELEDKLENLILQNEKEFMQSYEETIKLIIEDLYSKKAFENKTFLNLMKNTLVKIQKEYKFHYNYVKDNYNPNDKSDKNSTSKVKIRFNKHCKNSSDLALHTCKGLFYPILNDNKEILYVVCLSCEKTYLSSSVLMCCETCDCEYYTSILKNNESLNIVPATWDKYHCSALINDQMRCIKCKDYLYLNLKKNNLICQRCNFEADPKTIVWICMLCNGEFKSDAKPYNKLEYKLIKMAIKEALLNKQESKPNLLPCCNKDVETVSFPHKKDCNGILYQSDLIKGRKIVVCEKCKMMNDYNKFVWTCPFCMKRFKQKLVNGIDDNSRVYRKSMTDLVNLDNKNKDKDLIINSQSTSNLRYENLDMSSNKLEKNKLGISPFSMAKPEAHKFRSDLISNLNNSESPSQPVQKVKKEFENQRTPKNHHNSLSTSYSVKDLNKDFSNSNSSHDKKTEKKSLFNGINLLKLIENEANLICTRTDTSDKNRSEKSKFLVGTEKTNTNNSNSNVVDDKLEKNKNEELRKITEEEKLKQEKLEREKAEKAEKAEKDEKAEKAEKIKQEKLEKEKAEKIKQIEEIRLKKEQEKVETEKQEELRKQAEEEKIAIQKAEKLKRIEEKRIKKEEEELKKREKEERIKADKLKRIEEKRLKREEEQRKAEEEERIKAEKIKIQAEEKRLKREEELRIKAEEERLQKETELKRQEEEREKEKERERIRSEKLENERIAKLENERLEKERLEKERLEKERLEKERIEKERIEKERLKQEAEFKKQEEERIKKEKEKEEKAIKEKAEKEERERIKMLKQEEDRIKKEKEREQQELRKQQELRIQQEKLEKQEEEVRIKNEEIRRRKDKIKKQEEIDNQKAILKQMEELKNQKLNKSDKSDKNIKKFNNNSNSTSTSSNNIIQQIEIDLPSKPKNKSNKYQQEVKDYKDIYKDKTIDKDYKDNKDDFNKSDLGEFDLDDFQILNQIGEGSYGKIYLVVNTKTQRKYSMKKIIASEQFEIDQIYQEYELVNSVSHPGILKILATCYKKLDSTTFALYVLMDLAIYDWDKEIKSRQNSKKYFSEDDLMNILTQITSSLSFLQYNNISHRDIKPQNILVFDNMKYKIADFGEAKELVRRQRNQTDTLRGTELFMSPVLFYALQNAQFDIKHNCYKSDVYSLGLSMLYAAALMYNPIYDLRQCNNNKTVINILNKYFKTRYSDKFINLMSKLLELNETVRMDFIELSKFLNNYN